MALSDDDKKEIGGLILSTLGLEQGKTLAETIAKLSADTTNAIVNAYDKRAKGEREKELQKSLGLEEGQTLASVVEALVKKGAGDPPKKPDGSVDMSKLPEPVREMFAQQNQQLETLNKTLADEKKAREKADADRQKIEGERAVSAQREAIRRASLDKDGLGGWTFDPEMSEVLIEHLTGKVRKVEGKDAYEFQTGFDSATQSAVYKPLVDGLKEFGASTLGKRFRPAQPGGGGPGGGGGGGGGDKGAVPLTLEQLQGMTPKDIAAAAAGGKFTTQ